MDTPVWPSPKQVLDDLVKVRQGFGIRYESMLVVDHLPNLRAVHNQAARQKRNLETDARLIAYDVVRCVANSDNLLGERLKHVAVETLNFAQENSSLTERRSRLQTEFRISVGAYKKLETRTFQQLVGALLSLDESPCASSSPLARESSAIENEWKALADFDAVRFMEMAFMRLRFSRDHETAVEESRRILERIPNGVSKLKRVEGRRPTDPLQTLMVIARQITRSIYDEYARLAGVDKRLDGALFLDYLSTVHWGDLQSEATALERALEARGVVRYPFSRNDLHEISVMNDKLPGSLQLIAQAMYVLESKDAWHVAKRPAGSLTAASPAKRDRFGPWA